MFLPISSFLIDWRQIYAFSSGLAKRISAFSPPQTVV
jgi:hypothetical protein